MWIALQPPRGSRVKTLSPRPGLFPRAHWSRSGFGQADGLAAGVVEAPVGPGLPRALRHPAPGRSQE